MGGKYRKKNKWRREDATKAGELGSQRLHSGPNSTIDNGIPIDDGDFIPRSSNKPRRAYGGRRGHGKLWGANRTDNTKSPTRENVVQATDGANIPIILTDKGVDDQDPHFTEQKTNLTVAAKSSRAALDAQSGLSSGSPGRTASTVPALSPLDQGQEPQEVQIDVEAPQWRSTEEDERGRELNEEKVLHVTPDQLSAGSNTKEGDPAEKDYLKNETNSGLRPQSVDRGVDSRTPLDRAHGTKDQEDKRSCVDRAVVVIDDTPYSLAWAGGKKGRRLMRNVEDVLSQWLCEQEVKGVCVGEKIAAVRTLNSSNFATLRDLTQRLNMPDTVACAVGLRLRGRDWEELLGKIAAATDFLDLDAESACSSSLSAFGSQDSAPRPTDNVNITDLAALAQYEAAALDLAELELRHELRAQACRVALRSSPSAASKLFQSLDPDAAGTIPVSYLTSFASRLLGLASAESGAERISRATRRYGKASDFSSAMNQPRLTVAKTRDTALLWGADDRRSTAKGTPAISSFHLSSWSCNQCRIRRLRGVIKRLAREAADSSKTKREATGDGGEIPISLSAFCRFVEGKKFAQNNSLEGFLRTLSKTGKLLEPVSTSGSYRHPAIYYDQGLLPTTAERRSMSRIIDGPWGVASTARWGQTGVRRGSSQFANNAAPAKYSTFDSSTSTTDGGYNRSGGRGIEPVGQAHDMVATRPDRVGSGSGRGRTARNGRGGEGGGVTDGRGTPRKLTETHTPRDGISSPRGGDFVALVLSSFDVSGSGTLSSTEFISAASEITAQSPRKEWGDVLVTRFAASYREINGRGARTDPRGTKSTRWLEQNMDRESNGERMSIAALVDFLRPKCFSLSVMTPFGLVELSVEDRFFTLGDLREVVVNKMFWRQHNCQIRRSDRDNFTLSRFYGALPLDTESPGQRRRLVVDVLRPGELLFVTDRATRHGTQKQPRIVPKFQYAMGAPKQDAWSGSPRKGAYRRDITQRSPSAAQPEDRPSSTAITATAATARRIPTSPSPHEASSSSRAQLWDNLFEAGAEKTLQGAVIRRSNTSYNEQRHGNSGLTGGADSPDGDGSASSPTGCRGSTLESDDIGGVRSADGGVLSDMTEKGEKAGDCSDLVFEWSADQVELWISLTLELECCREAFQANEVDGSRLGGLREDDLMKYFGIRNAFHARKIVLHLDRLMEEALGPGAREQIPEEIASWRNRHFLIWCWRCVGLRHRPTLALLWRTGIDGLVLLAMTSEDWACLASTSSDSYCAGAIESLRQASTALLSGFPSRSPGLLHIGGGPSRVLDYHDRSTPKHKNKGSDRKGAKSQDSARKAPSSSGERVEEARYGLREGG